MATPDVVVIGAGQAGLSVAHELAAADIAAIVLERDRVGSSWARLWDSFRLNTPAWSVDLPGMPYDGEDPDGFLPRDEIVAHLQRYRRETGVDVREGVEVHRLTQADGAFELGTSAGPLGAAAVVVCTGAYQSAYEPPGTESLPADLPRLSATTYRNPAATPGGTVLVVGAGQSGCQIAEDLLDAGREVVLSVGKAAWAPRRLGDHDIVWWILRCGFMDQTLEDLPSPAARLAANVTASGTHGGHDLHPRMLRGKGARLVGRFRGYANGSFRFDDDLVANIAFSDARNADLMTMVERTCTEQGIPLPEIPTVEPFESGGPTALDVAGVGAVIFTGGFRPDYGWVEIPGILDDLGFPEQRDGASTVAPGLFFAGVHFLRNRRSSLLFGIGDDAAVVAAGVRRHITSA